MSWVYPVNPTNLVADVELVQRAPRAHVVDGDEAGSVRSDALCVERGAPTEGGGDKSASAGMQTLLSPAAAPLT